MKKIINKKLAIAVFALISFFPISVIAFGSFYEKSDVAPAAMASATTSLHIRVVAASFHVPNVSVVNAPSAVNEECSPIMQSPSHTAVQDPSNINLNQPANCFSLGFSHAAKIPQLSVMPLFAPVQAIVVIPVPASVISIAKFFPNTNPQKPNFIIVTFIIFTGTIFEFVKIRIKKVSFLQIKFRAQHLSLARFSIMKC